MDLKLENNIVFIHETDSTNNYANHQLAEGEVPEGTVFLAYSQKAGRGQMNNSWESEDGKNLTFSLVLKPRFLEIQKQFMLSKVVTLGICSVLKDYTEGIKIKWPNDIYAGDRKLGGILIENSVISGQIVNSVIGIGLNINQEKFVSNAPNPVSLKQLTGQDHDLLSLFEQIISTIKVYYRKLYDGNFKEINRLFLGEMYRFEERHRYKSGGSMFYGEITGVNEPGQLLIMDENKKLRQFHFKEVEFIL